MDLPLNLVLIACDLVIAALVRRGLRHAPGARSAWGALSAPVLVLLAAGPASLLFATDFFGVLRGLCWALFVHMPVVALAVAILVRRRGPSLVASAAAFALAIVGADAFLLEPTALEVTHYEVSSPKLREIPATRSFDVGPIRLSALSLGDSFDPQLELPRSAQLQIAFGHSPDFALGRVEADLLVAGHTHGGQVQVPGVGPLITFSEVPRGWASGLTKLPRDRTLVVSRGVGMERENAPRLRFNCRPEVVVIDLKPTG